MKKENKKKESPPKLKVKEEKKLFVLDTNIPLEHPDCIYGFKDNDVCIPFTVLDELDKFKKGSDSINLNAREFSRSLYDIIASSKSSKKNSSNDEMTSASSFPKHSKKVSLGKDMGRIFIASPSEKDLEPITSKSLADIPDHRILLTVCMLRKKSKIPVILITNDVILRIKATHFGIICEPYRNESVADMKKIYNSVIIKKLSDKEWESFYKKPGTDGLYPITKSLKKEQLNQLIILKSKDVDDQSILVRKLANGLLVIQRDKLKLRGFTPRNDEQYFALNALLDPKIELVALTGGAGTGKTILALAAALKLRKDFKEILVSRPAIELEGKTLGFLPGNMDEKIHPYMMPIYDNLDVLRETEEEIKKKGDGCSEKKDCGEQKEEEPIETWGKNKGINVLVTNFIRGRSLAKRFIIVDETQNLSHLAMKTILTRAGEGTKFVVIGDISQIDSPYLNEKTNGLSVLIDRMKGEPEFVHVHLSKGERSSLAEKISRLL